MNIKPKKVDLKNIKLELTGSELIRLVYIIDDCRSYNLTFSPEGSQDQISWFSLLLEVVADPEGGSVMDLINDLEMCINEYKSDCSHQVIPMKKKRKARKKKDSEDK